MRFGPAKIHHENWVDRVVGLKDVRSDIAVMRTPDGHGRLENLHHRTKNHA